VVPSDRHVDDKKPAVPGHLVAWQDQLQAAPALTTAALHSRKTAMVQQYVNKLASIPCKVRAAAYA